MKLIIVENNENRVARLPKPILDAAARILLYQSEKDYESAYETCACLPYADKLVRVHAWNLFDTLDGLYAENTAGDPRYAFLLNLCLENVLVPFDEKLSVCWTASKPEGTSRCFLYESGDRFTKDLTAKFGTQAVGTDMWRDTFLDYTSNAGLCRVLGIDGAFDDFDPKDEDAMLQKIDARNDQIRIAETDQAETQAKMDAYQAELKQETEKLKQKHGYDRIAERLRKDETDLAEMAGMQLRDKTFLIIGTLRSMFCADETVWNDTLEWLKKTFDIDIHYNSNVKSDKFAECFAKYESETCRRKWWSDNPEKHELQSNGYLWITQAFPYRWSPCIGTGIPTAVLDNVENFLHVCKGRRARMAAAWAARYVNENSLNAAKMAALRAALGDAETGETTGPETTTAEIPGE